MKRVFRFMSLITAARRSRSKLTSLRSYLAVGCHSFVITAAAGSISYHLIILLQEQRPHSHLVSLACCL
jgi:hypothetical protein